jgi:hypothetical protein
VIKTHEVVNRCGIAAEMLATLDYLKSERVLSKFSGVRTFINDIDDSRIGEDCLGAFKNSVVLISNRRDWFI